MKKPLLLELIVFAAVSAGTLGADLLVFLALSSFGFTPFLANICSSTFAAVCVYLASSKFAFLRKASISKGSAVIAWYLMATLLWSSVVQLVVDFTTIESFAAKIITVPFSFGANFVVSKYIIQKSSFREGRHFTSE